MKTIITNNQVKNLKLLASNMGYDECSRKNILQKRVEQKLDIILEVELVKRRLADNMDKQLKTKLQITY